MKQKKRGQVVKLPQRQQADQPNPKELAEKFPNTATFSGGEKQEVHENNFFKDMPLEEVRNRYVKFSVFMTEVNEVLCLDNHTATVEVLAHRIRDLVYANQREV